MCISVYTSVYMMCVRACVLSFCCVARVDGWPVAAQVNFLATLWNIFLGLYVRKEFEKAE